MALDIFITLVLVLFNGFFVAAEFAIVKVRLSQMEMKAKEGSRRADLSVHILSHLDGYLAATQLGITLASLGLGWVGEPVVSKIIINIMHLTGISITDQLAHQIALPIAFAIITILHIVFGELAPKSMAIQRAETVTLAVAYPLNVFYWIFKPFIWILNGFANIVLKVFGIHAVHGSEVHSSDELKYLIQQSGDVGEIATTNVDIIQKAFDFADRTAKHILVPRHQVISMDVTDFTQESIDRILDEGYSRIPCYEGNSDNIIGVIYLKDILTKIKRQEEIMIREMIRPVITIPETKRIGSLLKEFQLRHIHLAVVVDEYGGLVGIITMEDIVEELVGEIQDEYDNEIPVVEKVNDVTYKVIATASMGDINALLPQPLWEGEAGTLVGLLIQHYGKVPGISDKVLADGYEISVLKRIKSGISLVVLKLQEPVAA